TRPRAPTSPSSGGTPAVGWSSSTRWPPGARRTWSASRRRRGSSSTRCAGSASPPSGAPRAPGPSRRVRTRARDAGRAPTRSSAVCTRDCGGTRPGHPRRRGPGRRAGGHMSTVLLAHGSPDRRHAETLDRLRARVSVRIGPTRLAFLEHDLPRPEALAGDLAGRVGLVPLLATPAHHARVDLPGAVARLATGGADVRRSRPLGGHRLLLGAVAERLLGAGHP